jgi:phosphate transport system substrate-binding protein
MTRRNSLAAFAALCSLGLPAFGQISVTGAGATFPEPIYTKWFAEYRKVRQDVQVNYQGIGSGGGIRGATEGTVDFGASDGPMTDEQLKAFRDKRGFGVLHFPTVLGAVVPVYNLPGVSAELDFTPEALAGIFLGKITKWDDPLIAKANPKVKLPSSDIIVVHRSDASGTTYVWCDYLSKISDEWKTRVGKSTAVNWPVGLGGSKNEGVAGQVKQSANSIGYVELIYAAQTKMTFGRVRNSSGTFLRADLDSVTAAAAGVEMPDDFRVSITNASGKTAYPIASFTWLLIPEQIEDKQKLDVITGFLRWMLGPGQKLTSGLQYAPLPKPVVAKEEKAITKVHGKA